MRSLNHDNHDKYRPNKGNCSKSTPISSTIQVYCVGFSVENLPKWTCQIECLEEKRHISRAEGRTDIFGFEYLCSRAAYSACKRRRGRYDKRKINTPSNFRFPSGLTFFPIPSLYFTQSTYQLNVYTRFTRGSLEGRREKTATLSPRENLKLIQ